MAEPSRPALIRRLPLLLILLGAGIGAFALRDVISFDRLAQHRQTLLAFRDSHYLAAVCGFVAAYAAIVAFSLPGATVATLAGGFLFGLFPGVVYNVLAATIGAVAVFQAARMGWGAEVASRLKARGGKAARLVAGLQRNVWSALLVMRLVPVVPFFLANLIPAFAGVRLWPFAVTTLVGIIPAGLVFTSVGAGLDAVFASGQQPDLSVIFSGQVLGPLLGLAALSALPMFLRAIKGGTDDADQG